MTSDILSNAYHHYYPSRLASLVSVKNAALQVIALDQAIDVFLLCNAGGTFSHFTLTEDGVDIKNYGC